jgi:uncharacterized protein YgbK (DUF1537 family)
MIGVIADDLTGAAEIGAVGLRHGLRAEIVHGGKPTRRAELVCVNTNSRSCRPDEANKRATMAVKRLQDSGARWIYKKVDSVLRGQVTVELEAVMQQLKLNRALLLPANPSLGRVIRNGQYFIHNKPLHKTEFAHDPEFPRHVSQVLQLLKASQRFCIRMAEGKHSISNNTIVIGEAMTLEELKSWAIRLKKDVLPAGGVDFFGALLEAKGIPKRTGALLSPGMQSGNELFVCGSFTESVRKFLRSARQRRTPIFSLPQESILGAELSVPTVEGITKQITDAFVRHKRVILCVGLPFVRNSARTHLLSDCVARIAVSVLRSTRITNVYAEGGATSAELVRRMRWRQLTVQHELAPGVVTVAGGGRQSTLLTIKPGTYSWPV